MWDQTGFGYVGFDRSHEPSSILGVRSNRFTHNAARPSVMIMPKPQRWIEYPESRVREYRVDP